jgi:uncharacterized membrane protein (DUF441 family)
MTDQLVTKVEADASAVVADAKADATKVVTVVKTTWLTKILPWLTHAGVAIGAFVLEHRHEC